MAHLGFTLDEDLTDQGLEGLCQSRVRDVAFVLVELAGREEAARRNKRLVQLVYHRRFADAGITGYEHQLGGTLGHHPIERRKQSIDLALPPVQLLWDQQSVRRSRARPAANGSMRPCDCHPARHRRRSASKPEAVW